MSMLDLYFKHVNPWCPILDRRVTFDLFFERGQIAEGDYLVLHAIVATTLRFSQDARLTLDSRQRYHFSLQALVIFAWDFIGSSDGSGSGNIIALIVRNIIQFDLQLERTLCLQTAVRAVTAASRFRDRLLPGPGSWIEDEGRRRLFWVAYINRFLPCRYDLFSKTSQSRPAGPAARGAQIGSSTTRRIWAASLTTASIGGDLDAVSYQFFIFTLDQMRQHWSLAAQFAQHLKQVQALGLNREPSRFSKELARMRR
ncbi:fungal specific transcription factor domain-containing protein [Aspergillus lucknowensis]|uniref:Xylanolytic transcriptional activator regulatory domain-containing protein n=1 Tax=Aspergillus lucknowensis TaxID=176173 RepID=A0ABR4L985_9EURO